MSWLSSIVGAVFGGGRSQPTAVESSSNNDIVVENETTTIVEIDLDLDGLGGSIETGLEEFGETVSQGAGKLANNAGILIAGVALASFIAR